MVFNSNRPHLGVVVDSLATGHAQNHRHTVMRDQEACLRFCRRNLTGISEFPREMVDETESNGGISENTQLSDQGWKRIRNTELVSLS